MKGITPVFAVILLLVLTIVVVSVLAVALQKATAEAGSQIEKDLDRQISYSGQRIRIEAASLNSATVRNVGSESIEGNSIAFFINGGHVQCSGISALQPREFATCTLSQSCDRGDELRASAPGNIDTLIC